MEKFNRVIINGGWKLPLGVRFHPTDIELLVYYLRRKCFCLPLPTSIIPEFNVFLTAPWNLPGDSREKRYFFSNKEQDLKTNKKPFRKVVAGFGYWKQRGKDRKISVYGTNPIVGIKKTLIFYGGTHSKTMKTRWIMHEFYLEESSLNSSNTIQMFGVGCGNWKVYKVFRRKMRPEKHGNIASHTSAFVIDFKSEDATRLTPPPPVPSSPCSRLVDEEEIST